MKADLPDEPIRSKDPNAKTQMSTFECNVCHINCSNKSNLKRHMLRHSKRTKSKAAKATRSPLTLKRIGNVKELALKKQKNRSTNKSVAVAGNGTSSTSAFDSGSPAGNVLRSTADVKEPVPATAVVESKPSSTEPIEICTNDQYGDVKVVEMLEPDTDCEMNDLSAIEQHPQLQIESAKLNAPAPAPVLSRQNNEAEQKIDDVENSISNSLNGKSLNIAGASDSLKSPAAHPQINTELHKNGSVTNRADNDGVSVGIERSVDSISSNIIVDVNSTNTAVPAIKNELLKGRYFVYTVHRSNVHYNRI